MPKADVSERLATLEHHVNENFFEIQRRLDELLKFEDRAKENFLQVERMLVDFEHKGGAAPATSQADVQSLKSHLEEKIKALEDVLMLLEIEVVRFKERGAAPTGMAAQFGVTPKIPSGMDDRLKTLEEKFKTLEKLKLNVPVELIQHEPRLKGIEANVLAVQKSMREEVSKLENMISGRMPTEQATERFIQKMREEMDELRRDIEKAEMLKHEILEKERAFATRPDLNAFEARISADVKKIHDLTDRVAAAERSLDTKLVDIDEKIQDSVKDFQNVFRKEVASHVKNYEEAEGNLSARLNRMESDLSTRLKQADSNLSAVLKRTEDSLSASIQQAEKKLYADIDSRVRAVDAHIKDFDAKVVDLETEMRQELEVHRHENDKKLIDMEERVAKVAAETATEEAIKDVKGAMSAHRSEVNAAMQRVAAIERELESRATGIVSKELAAFSEAIDKKFPDLVTKADFMEWSRAVAERVRTIEAPDLSPLVIRMDDLELRVNELSGLLREIANRMPLVIE